jgi:mono/diheme cytochrome c family protein
MRAAAAVRRRPRRRTPVSYARSVSRNDVILGIAALVLVGFALVVSIWLPRRNPNFPGRHVGALLLVAGLLIIAMLTAVEVFSESHHFESAAGESGATETEPAPTTSAPTETTAPTETGGGGGGPTGDPAAGKEIFTTTAQPPCASCHTLAEANASGTVGPDLDQVLKGKDEAFIHESIVNPDAEIASGFTAGVMPATYGEQLDDQQLADLVAFLEQAANG